MQALPALRGVAAGAALHRARQCAMREVELGIGRARLRPAAQITIARVVAARDCGGEVYWSQGA